VKAFDRLDRINCFHLLDFTELAKCTWPVTERGIHLGDLDGAECVYFECDSAGHRSRPSCYGRHVRYVRVESTIRYDVGFA
jgi:hypothetical protein